MWSSIVNGPTSKKQENLQSECDKVIQKKTEIKFTQLKLSISLKICKIYKRRLEFVFNFVDQLNIASGSETNITTSCEMEIFNLSGTTTYL